jgi:prophage antirepressor-like protein
MAFAGEAKPLVMLPVAHRAVAVDDPRASILPSAVPPQLPDRELVRDIELGERVGLRNPVDIRPRIARLVRQGMLPKTSVVRAADGEHLLSREAAVLVTMRLKLKKRVQLEVVRALLVGAQQPYRGPVALAADVPPVSAAPPIVMNGEGATATFEGHTIPVYVFRGRPVIIAGDLGRALDYADDGHRLVDSIRDNWRAEFTERDIKVLTGDDLRAFKALLALTPSPRVSGRTPHLTILFETGMDLACQKAQTEAGARLRRYLADHVLPKLRRGEPVTAGGTRVPLVPAAPVALGPTRRCSRPEDTPRFHPVLVGRLDETSRRLTILEDQGRQLEARLARFESRPPWLA